MTSNTQGDKEEARFEKNLAAGLKAINDHVYNQRHSVPTPPIQPDTKKLKEEIALLYRDSHTPWPDTQALLWPDVFADRVMVLVEQALERERLEAQTAAAVTIREKLANATTNTPAWAGGVEIVNDYIEENEARLSTLTNKDKDNDR